MLFVRLYCDKTTANRIKQFSLQRVSTVSMVSLKTKFEGGPFQLIIINYIFINYSNLEFDKKNKQ